MPILVLSAGRDQILLKTRDDILVTLGCIVTPVSNSADFVSEFFGGDYDMLVLCHSVPAEERKRILRLVKNYRPSLHTILIANMNDGYLPKDLPEFGVRIDSDPEDLVKAVASAFPPSYPA
jgi:hypothetical protein